MHALATQINNAFHRSKVSYVAGSGRSIRPLVILKAKMYRPYGLPKTTFLTG